MSTVAEFLRKLEAIPGDWRIAATKSGRSIEAWEPGGHRVARIFTTDRPTQWMTYKERAGD